VRTLLAVAGALALALSACGGAVPFASPTPTSSPATQRVQIFYARADESPVPVALEIAAGLTVDQRIKARLIALSTAPWLGPEGSFNVLRQSAQVSTVSVAGPIATTDFAVPDGDWGLPARTTLRAFMQQLVFTATDEKSVSEVRLTQNGGQDAVIVSAGAIVTYQAPMTRESVAPYARPDHTVAYYARDEGAPVAVFLEGAGLGATAEQRVTSRLVALESGPAQTGADAFNVVASMKARLRSVAISGDLVTIDYSVPQDDWGVNGSVSLRALVQQLVFTASEEPGIVRVLITQNGGLQAIIGGEGLVVDRPQTRRGLLGD